LLLLLGELLLVVAVGVHDSHEHREELPLVLRRQGGEEGVEVLHGEGAQEGGHGLLLLLLDPLPLEGLEEQFVEFGHQTEAGALVEEVEFLVVLVVSPRLGSDFGGGLVVCSRFEWYLLLFLVILSLRFRFHLVCKLLFRRLFSD
jgi:hypothetical protein